MFDLICPIVYRPIIHCSHSMDFVTATILGLIFICLCGCGLFLCIDWYSLTWKDSSWLYKCVMLLLTFMFLLAITLNIYSYWTPICNYFDILVDLL